MLSACMFTAPRVKRQGKHPRTVLSPPLVTLTQIKGNFRVCNRLSMNGFGLNEETRMPEETGLNMQTQQKHPHQVPVSSI